MRAKAPNMVFFPSIRIYLSPKIVHPSLLIDYKLNIAFTKVNTEASNRELNFFCRYVVWNSHNPAPGVYNWDGQNDLVAFLQMAQEVGLNVLLRGGPYICGEWEYVRIYH